VGLSNENEAGAEPEAGRAPPPGRFFVALAIILALLGVALLIAVVVYNTRRKISFSWTLLAPAARGKSVWDRCCRRALASFYLGRIPHGVVATTLCSSYPEKAPPPNSFNFFRKWRYCVK